MGVNVPLTRGAYGPAPAESVAVSAMTPVSVVVPIFTIDTEVGNTAEPPGGIFVRRNAMRVPNWASAGGPNAGIDTPERGGYKGSTKGLRICIHPEPQRRIW